MGWSLRLYRSLELYLQPLGEGEQGMLGFFHQQMVFAVRRRYLRVRCLCVMCDHWLSIAQSSLPRALVCRRCVLCTSFCVSIRSRPHTHIHTHTQHNRFAEARVCATLAQYFGKHADPNGDHSWTGTSRRAHQDLVYYQLRALMLPELRHTLGSLKFIQARAKQGTGGMEHLLRDYHDAQEQLRTLKYSILKERLISADSSRQAQLQWLGEFMVFASSHHQQLCANPVLVYQYALNQPDSSAPAKAASHQLQLQLQQLRSQLVVASRLTTAEHTAEQASEQAKAAHRLAKKSGSMEDRTAEDEATQASATASALVVSLQAHARANGLDGPPRLDHIPRRWVRWVNKPQRNRIVADFAGSWACSVRVLCTYQVEERSCVCVGGGGGRCFCVSVCPFACLRLHQLVVSVWRGLVSRRRVWG